MKTLKELGISPTPWEQGHEYVSDDMVFDANGHAVGEGLEVANARLISAAPELYEALREMCERVEGGDVHFTGASAWLAKARIALEKAGGNE